MHSLQFIAPFCRSSYRVTTYVTGDGSLLQCSVPAKTHPRTRLEVVCFFV